METERAALTRQALAGLAPLEGLADGVPAGAPDSAMAAPARLSGAELEAVAAGLAILLDAVRRLDP
jgi:hypothetical protein